MQVFNIKWDRIHQLLGLEGLKYKRIQYCALSYKSGQLGPRIKYCALSYKSGQLP
jgi:hypothetical protein